MVMLFGLHILWSSNLYNDNNYAIGTIFEIKVKGRRFIDQIVSMYNYQPINNDLDY